MAVTRVVAGGLGSGGLAPAPGDSGYGSGGLKLLLRQF